MPDLNNNRGNNRRRGRGNNRPQGGGQQQLNRIDSRARGNAPQLLEKYRKMAQDAHLNGDRVQAEYYLQFADHYFRVLADARLRQEEQRQRHTGQSPVPNGGANGGQAWGQNSDRWGDPEDDTLDFSADSDFGGFDRQTQFQPQPAFQAQPAAPSPAPRRDDFERRRYEQRPQPAELFDTDEEQAVDASAEAVGFEGVRADESGAALDPADNPFIRDNRALRGQRRRGYERPSERADRRPRRERAPVAGTLDPASLPPSIGVSADPAPELPIAPPAPQPVAEPAMSEAAPAPKRRGRPRKNPLPEPVAPAD